MSKYLYCYSDLLEERRKGKAEGRKEVLDACDNFIKDRTLLRGATATHQGTHLIRFMPFEWEDFKKKLEEGKK